MSQTLRLVVQDIYERHTPDGPDFVRRCEKHEWQSLPVLSNERPGLCPKCAEESMYKGRKRYAEFTVEGV